MKILVVGSTGGSGRAVVDELLGAGHEVSAFSRNTERITTRSERLRCVNGDATDAADVERAVRGHDAVVVTLGISEKPDPGASVRQPVHLNDAAEGDDPFASTEGDTGSRMQVSRRSVARFLARATAGSEFIGKSVALSGA
jgi:uncharacterized protein YbjT (DUF2867 family)